LILDSVEFIERPIHIEGVKVLRRHAVAKQRYLQCSRWALTDSALPRELLGRESNIPEVDKPSVREVPVDVAGRFRALQELLRSQGEFESRYPAAFEILFPRYARRRERVGLHLPSFEVHVLKNWVHPHVEMQDRFSGADAHTSVSRWWHKDWRLHEPHRLIAGPGLDDLQGVLLAILGREEDGERVGFFPPRFTPEMEGIRIPEEMPIRLTDLRLAGQFQSGALQQGIKPILDLLHRPSSAEHVLSTHLRSARQQHKSGVLCYVSVDSC
jgi:hypothetical protein